MKNPLQELNYIINRHRIVKSYANNDLISRGYPWNIKIESTPYCNLNCVMCPNQTMKRKKGYIDLELVKKIIDESKKYTELISLHYMGEPLMHPNLPEMIVYGKQAGMDVIMSSNATFLDKNNSQKIIEAGLDLLILDFDAATKKTYEKIRVNANFEKNFENITNFLQIRDNMGKKNPLTVVQAVESDTNKTEMNDFIKMWEKYPLDSIKVRGAHSWGGQIENIHVKQTVNSRPCFDLWCKMIICWDGTAVPCCPDFDGNYPLGNAKTQTIKEIWNGKPMQKLRKHQIELDYRKNPLCKDCNPKDIGARNLSSYLRSQLYKEKAFFEINR